MRYLNNGLERIHIVQFRYICIFILVDVHCHHGFNASLQFTGHLEFLSQLYYLHHLRGKVSAPFSPHLLQTASKTRPNAEAFHHLHLPCYTGRVGSYPFSKPQWIQPAFSFKGTGTYLWHQMRKSEIIQKF